MINVLTLLSILATTRIISQPTTFYQFVAIQNQNQTYFSYLPYIQTCDYNVSNFFPGSIQIQPIQNSQFFLKVQYQGVVQFWSSVYNGFNIYLLLLQTTLQYSGYILYDSPYVGFQRQIILYTIGQTNLTFYYAVPTLITQNATLNITIVNTIVVQLPTEAWEMVKNCPSNNKNSFAYVGNKTFLYVCGQVASSFTFIPGLNQSFVNIYKFEDIGLAIYEVTPNPFLLDTVVQLNILLWDSLMLVKYQNLTTLYFIKYQHNTLNITIFESKKNEISQVFNKIWGYQYEKQMSKWMDIFNSIGAQMYTYIPGDLVSVFVNDKQDIYVQSSIEDGTNYLCIFSSKGQLYQNISFEGEIFFYGKQQIFLYNQNTSIFSSLTVQRPIYIINPTEFGNQSTTQQYSYLNVTIPCEYVNITVEYKILWSSPIYPSGLVQLVVKQPIYSNESVYAIEVSDRFIIFGPDFKIIPSPPSNVQVIVVECSQLSINYKVIGIVNVQIYSQNTFEIIVASNTSIYEINSKNRIKLLMSQPCGFDLITSATLVNQSYYQITNSIGQVCLCSQDFQVCNLYQNNNQQPLEQIRQQSLINSLIQSYNSNQTTPIKKNLFQIIRKGLAVSILTDNRAVLVNINNNKILDVVNISCQNPGQLNGIIFEKQFYDPFLLLFCQQYTFIYQYVIRYNKLIPMRQIYTYRFQTRAGMDVIRQSDQYVFLQVDSILDVYPFPPNCCILRLDPCQFTVSVIRQIIYSQSIIGTFSSRNLDIALLNSNPVGKQSQCLIKVYFPNSWIIFNLTNYTDVIIDQQPITINFISSFYNFQAYYNLTASFNLTNANLNLTKNVQEQKKKSIQTINFNYSDQYDADRPYYQAVVNYNLSSYVCGPIFDSFFIGTNPSQKTLQIRYTNLITKSKLIGSIRIQFLQLIDPQDWEQQQFTLNNLLLFVTTNTMLVYGKMINNTQLVFIDEFKLTQKYCTYYIYEIINQTAALLYSECQGFNSKFQVPLLIINYDNVTNQVSTSFSWMNISFSMREIYTIPLPNNTLVVGILQGPMNANTGKLIICENFQCSPLYISTTFLFLINYDTYVFNTTLYYVMSIDAQQIQVFINPVVQEGNQKIMYNYTFNYTQYIKQDYCSVLKILNASNIESFITVSCSSYYYIMVLNFSSNLTTIKQKFSRYSQCALYDDFKPQTIQTPENGLQMMITQCRQNDYTLKLETYQTVDSSTVVIHTGFMQIFIMSGPLAPNCSNDSLSPAKVIPVATSMQRPLFIVYKMNNTLKLIYSQIKGILIDNFITISPQIDLIFEPISENYKFPSLYFLAINEFHQKAKIIQTSFSVKKKITILNIIVFVFFLLANLVNVIFVIAYFIQRNSLKVKREEKDNENQFEQGQYQQTIKSITSKVKNNRYVYRSDKSQTTKKGAGDNSKRKQVHRPRKFTEIQMFFVKQKTIDQSQNQSPGRGKQLDIFFDKINDKK